MNLLKDFVKGIGGDKKVLKAKFKEAEQDMRIQKMLQERQKSADERDLEHRMEKKRQERIKIKLDKLRKEDANELWRSKNSILKSNNNILKDDRPILQEKNIFNDNKNIFLNKQRIFMKGG